jgi:hypothetical protein
MKKDDSNTPETFITKEYRLGQDVAIALAHGGTGERIGFKSATTFVVVAVGTPARGGKARVQLFEVVPGFVKRKFCPRSTVVRISVIATVTEVIGAVYKGKMP